MKIGAFTVAWSSKPLEEVLDFLVDAGVQAIELGCGNYPGNAHCNPFELNESAADRKALLKMVADRGLVISGLSCHGNPLHPDKKIATANHEVWQATVKLAKNLGIQCVNGFSGLPAGGPDDKVPNWVVAPWPEDHLQALEYQWAVATEYWTAEAKNLKKAGVYACFEMHPNFLVYNPETLIKLRKAVGANGDRICANYDPSHLFWQGIDNTAAIRWLGEQSDPVIRHFHAKDSLVYDWNARVNGVLDTKHYGDEINRSWIFRSVGYGHGADVWKDILSTLRMVGYDGALSIEHEDSLMTNDEGFLKAVAMLKECAMFQAKGGMTWA